MDLWKLHEKPYLSIVITQVRLLGLLNVAYSRTLSQLPFFLSLRISIYPGAIAKGLKRKKSDISDYHSYLSAYYEDHIYICLCSSD